MALSISTESAALSARLYAEGFSLPIEEAEQDLAALCRAGAIPLALMRDGTVLSQGLGVPIQTEGGAVLYLYALTTDRTARGQGLLRTLLRECAEPARALGFSALCLIPANAALFEAYRRMGFTEELSAGGAPHIDGAADLDLHLAFLARPISNGEANDLYAALGKHMTREMFDYTLGTLAPAVLPMRTDRGYALASVQDPHYVLASSCPAKRVGAHRILAMSLGSEMPISIPEPLPR